MPKSTEEQKAYARAYYQANKERCKANTRAYREANPDCRKGEKKRYREKYPEKVKADGLAYYHAHREERRAFHAANKERLNAKSKAYYAANRERMKAAAVAHRHANRESICRKARERARATGHAAWKAWCKANRTAYQAIRIKKYNKRRALMRGSAVGTDRKAYLRFVAELKTRPSAKCYWCGKVTTPKDRHIDHIIPIAKGGPDDVNNLCASCCFCNCSKRDKLPEEFTGQGVLRLG